MGGHGHGHEPPYEVPSPHIYKVENVPELKMVQERLAEKGLKDPWLRNEVWRYTQTPREYKIQIFRTFTRGLLLGIPAFLITLGIENAFGISYKPAHDHEDPNHNGHH